MQKSPAEVLYDALNVTTMPWMMASDKMRHHCEDLAQKVIESVPPKEVLPKQYFDATIMEVKFHNDAQRRGKEIKIELFVPDVDMHNAKPGSIEETLEAIVELHRTQSGKLRISPYTDNAIKSELSRLNRDGTVRELAEDEGTW